MTVRLSILVVAALSASTVVYATDIYRWVDDSGQTQISDTVPTRYKDVAIKIDTSASTISETQRQEAVKRAREDRREADARADKINSSSVTSTENKAVNSASPTSSSGRNDNCEELMKAYRESQECFAPFILRRPDGRPRQPLKIRAEAYDYCTPVPDPSERCGLPTTP